MTDTTGQELAPALSEPVRPVAAPIAKLELAEGGVLTVTASDESSAYLHACLGTQSPDFTLYCLKALVNLLPATKGETDFTLDVNAALAMLSAINPQDELEAMLAVQMIASNHLGLNACVRTKNSDLLQSRQMNGNLANKFQRTFVAQLEALGKHRRGGKQIVEHVHVNAGGQAVIANTVNTGRGA